MQVPTTTSNFNFSTIEYNQNKSIHVITSDNKKFIINHDDLVYYGALQFSEHEISLDIDSKIFKFIQLYNTKKIAADQNKISLEEFESAIQDAIYSLNVYDLLSVYRWSRQLLIEHLKKDLYLLCRHNSTLDINTIQWLQETIENPETEAGLAQFSCFLLIVQPAHQRNIPLLNHLLNKFISLDPSFGFNKLVNYLIDKNPNASDAALYTYLFFEICNQNSYSFSVSFSLFEKTFTHLLGYGNFLAHHACLTVTQKIIHIENVKCFLNFIKRSINPNQMHYASSNYIGVPYHSINFWGFSVKESSLAFSCVPPIIQNLPFTEACAAIRYLYYSIVYIETLNPQRQSFFSPQDSKIFVMNRFSAKIGAAFKDLLDATEHLRTYCDVLKKYALLIQNLYPWIEQEKGNPHELIHADILQCIFEIPKSFDLANPLLQKIYKDFLLIFKDGAYIKMIRSFCAETSTLLLQAFDDFITGSSSYQATAKDLVSLPTHPSLPTLILTPQKISQIFELIKEQNFLALALIRQSEQNAKTQHGCTKKAFRCHLIQEMVKLNPNHLAEIWLLIATFGKKTRYYLLEAFFKALDPKNEELLIFLKKTLEFVETYNDPELIGYVFLQLMKYSKEQSGELQYSLLQLIDSHLSQFYLSQLPYVQEERMKTDLISNLIITKLLLGKSLHSFYPKSSLTLLYTLNHAIQLLENPLSLNQSSFFSLIEIITPFLKPWYQHYKQLKSSEQISEFKKNAQNFFNYLLLASSHYLDQPILSTEKKLLILAEKVVTFGIASVECHLYFLREISTKFPSENIEPWISFVLEQIDETFSNQELRTLAVFLGERGHLDIFNKIKNQFKSKSFEMHFFSILYKAHPALFLDVCHELTEEISEKILKICFYK